jgi:hypothetical protein
VPVREAGRSRQALDHYIAKVVSYCRAMRIAMRVVFALALPGIVFGWLTRVPPLVFSMEFDFFASEVGWIDVLAAVAVATTVASIVAVAVVVMVKLGIGRAQHPGRRIAR